MYDLISEVPVHQAVCIQREKVRETVRGQADPLYDDGWGDMGA